MTPPNKCAAANRRPLGSGEWLERFSTRQLQPEHVPEAAAELDR